jgi:hypothetical protein
MTTYYNLRLVTTITSAAIDSVVLNLDLGCTDYVPAAAPIENSAATTGYIDGGTQQFARWRNRQEEIEIKFNDVATYEEAERVLNTAHLRAENVATPRLYLYAKRIGDADFWRSRLYTARLTPSDGMGGFLKSGSPFMGTLEIERDYYWERAAVEQIIFDDPVGVGGVPTRSIINDWSFAAPAPTAPIAKVTRVLIEGTLPAPLDLFFKNTGTIGVDHISRIHIGHNWRSMPTTFEPRLGNLVTTPISGSAEQGLYGVAILAPAMATMRGDWFRVLLAASGGLPQDALFSIELEDTFGSLLYKSPQVAIWYGGQTLIDVGSVPLPPAAIPNPAVINVRVMIQLPSNSGTVSVSSVLFLMPADSYRMLIGQPGSNLKAGDTLFDLQSIDVSPYAVQNFFGTSYYPMTPHYGKIWLMPGRHNSLYALVTDAADAMNTSLTYDISGEYRPRRLTI